MSNETPLHIDWMQDRLGKFTASGIGVLFSKAPKLTEGAKTYIHRKVGETITQTSNEASSPAIEWGEQCEPLAASMFAELIGSGFEYYGKETPLFFAFGDDAGGSPDGILPELDAVVEIKCPYESYKHSEAVHGIKSGTFDLQDFDPKYYAQCQFNMLVTDKSTCYFVSFDPRWMIEGDRLIWAVVPRNDEYLTILTDRLFNAISLKHQILKEVGYYDNVTI